MTKTPDMTAMFKDIMGAFPVDNAAMQDAFKNTASLNEKLSGVAFDAAEKSADISTAWTKAMTDFASASAESAAEHMAAFAEIAKKVQMDTVELMMSAGKEFQSDATAAATKTAENAQAAAKKSTVK